MSTTRSTSRRGPIIGIVVLAIVVAGAAGLWYLFFRPSGPAPVSLGTLPPVAAASSNPTNGSGAAGSAATAPAAPTAAAGSGTRSSTGVDGTWTVDPSVGSFSDFSGSFVGYRVREQLATVGAQEAVGRTPDISGTVTLDGTRVTAVELTADLTTLQSDEANRDRQLSHQALETSQFPTATFKLTQPVDLGSIPAEGATVSVTATGDLTLHGVTKSVQVTMQARLQNGVITIAGSLPILFADYSIAPPQSMMVLSVEDHGTMEFQLQLTKTAA